MKVQIPIPETGKVSGIVDDAKSPVALLVLAHGAGAGISHPTMGALSKVLIDNGISTLRFQFPYMEQKSKRPDRAAIAVRAIASAVQCALELRPKLPIFAGGKSFGGRMTTTAAAQGLLPDTRGILCFGFPLHPPAKPGIERAAHLDDVSQPMQCFQGTRDTLAEVPLVEKVARAHRGKLRVHVLQGADHGFHVLKSSGRTDEEVLLEIGKVSREFIDLHR